MHQPPPEAETKRLTEYRNHVWLENSAGSLRVFCGGVGLMVLLLLALRALVAGVDGGLFDGAMVAVLIRFGKFALFLVCLIGLFPAWRDYSEAHAKECLGRKEMLARIEADPEWWRKRDEEQRDREKQRKELEAWLASQGHEAKSTAQESALAILTRQIREYKSPPGSPKG